MPNVTCSAYCVGKNDGSVPVQRFATEAEAEACIAAFAEVDPSGVERGDYYIDAPEITRGPFVSIGTAYGSHGDIRFDLQTGVVLPGETYGEDPLFSPTRFDVDEYRATYNEEPTDVDILDIGYWMGADYEPPESDFRQWVNAGLERLRREGGLLDV